MCRGHGGQHHHAAGLHKDGAPMWQHAPHPPGNHHHHLWHLLSTSILLRICAAVQLKQWKVPADDRQISITICQAAVSADAAAVQHLTTSGSTSQGIAEVCGVLGVPGVQANHQGEGCGRPVHRHGPARDPDGRHERRLLLAVRVLEGPAQRVRLCLHACSHALRETTARSQGG